MSENHEPNPADRPEEPAADARPEEQKTPAPQPIEDVTDGCECACDCQREAEGCGCGAEEEGCGGCGSSDGVCGGCAGSCAGQGASGDGAEASQGGAQPASEGAAGAESAPRFLVNVRYGMMAVLADFLTDLPDLRTGDMVIMKTDRGIDHGTVAKKPVPVPPGCTGFEHIIRKATESDHNILEHIKNSKEPEELKHCHERITERGLPMKLAGIEHLFGGDKVIFYFLADGRVDFRELVKDLARRYRTRIEMRQIGVRDEAKMLSDYEHCGRELCCRTFMRELEPVTMRMAKIQKSTLDPSKISGHCGRLMCCLRFEDEVYKEHKKTLPHRSDIIRTQSVSGRVINSEILSQLVEIEQQDGTRVKVHVSEIVDRVHGSGGGGDDDGDGERSNFRGNGGESGGGAGGNSGNGQRGNRDNRNSRGGRGGRDNRDNRGGKGERGERGERPDRGNREGGNRDNRERGNRDRGDQNGRENAGGASGAENKPENPANPAGDSGQDA